MPSVLPSDEELAALVPPRGSVTWRAASDLRLGAVSGCTLLLQVAHPVVGAGVAEHSTFQADPWGRLLRTLDYVNGTIYGGPELAGEIGRRVRAMHRDIKGVRPDGKRYHALEPAPYAWVHATLASAIVDGHARFGTPLSAAEQRAFWAEWLRVGRLIGVREHDLPADWADFRPYFDGVVATALDDNAAVRQVLESLAAPTAPPIALPPGVWPVLRRPAAWQARLTTLGTLPPVLRERFGVRWTTRQQKAYNVLAAASRASGPLLVGRLRTFGPTYVKLRHAALERGDVAARAA